MSDPTVKSQEEGGGAKGSPGITAELQDKRDIVAQTDPSKKQDFLSHQLQHPLHMNSSVPRSESPLSSSSVSKNSLQCEHSEFIMKIYNSLLKCYVYKYNSCTPTPMSWFCCDQIYQPLPQTLEKYIFLYNSSFVCTGRFAGQLYLDVALCSQVVDFCRFHLVHDLH